MTSNVIVAHDVLAWSGGSIGAHCNHRAGAVKARPRHKHSAGRTRHIGHGPRDAGRRLRNLSTCCFLHCGGIAGPERADLRRARCMAAAFPELRYPTTVLPLATASKTPASVGRERQALSTPSPGEPAWTGLPVLILMIPNNPILQSCARPDCNCGATPARTGMCVHIKETRKIRCALPDGFAMHAVPATAAHAGRQGRR